MNHLLSIIIVFHLIEEYREFYKDSLAGATRDSLSDE